jgi:hypothetical protein
MVGKKIYRHKDNPKEAEFHNRFVKRFVNSPNYHGISQIVNEVDGHGYPKTYLSDNEKQAVITAIQWLGSPVGQGFLRDCGFELKNK